MDAATLDAHFRLNLFTPLLLSQALVKAAGPIATGDCQYYRPAHGKSARDQISYTFSKQALAASVRTMANFIWRKSARVNGVAPGLVIVTDDYAAGQAERLADMMPLARFPTPAGVADAVLYFANAQAMSRGRLYSSMAARIWKVLTATSCIFNGRARP